ncbi:MAG: hypothetical protein K2X27_19575 [Candidatus Obscuribacterales bacterium]|nr:hypothetical protein [Candidatus Obscuribacterales bacterium]
MRLILLKLLVLFVLLSSQSYLAYAGTDLDSRESAASSSSGNGAGVLKGQITNQDRLSPLGAEFRVGARLDLAGIKKLQALTPDNNWDRIPDWFAGDWKQETSTSYYRYDYCSGGQDFGVDTGLALSKEHRGWQRDNAGNIWEYSYRNYIGVTECEDIWAISYVKDTELLLSAGDRIVMRFLAVSVHVDKESRQILRNAQTESIQTYTPAGPGIVKVNASVKAFDQMGNPMLLNKLIAYERCLKPFRPIDSYRGKNMRVLFAEYLQSHGLGKLIPAGANQGRGLSRK